MSLKVTGKHEHEGACVASMEFYTNGLQGGNAREGGVFELKIENMASGNFEIEVDGKRSRVERAALLRFIGDDEIRFALDSIKSLGEQLNALKKLA